jgi:hypothetical protein
MIFSVTRTGYLNDYTYIFWDVTQCLAKFSDVSKEHAFSIVKVEQF